MRRSKGNAGSPRERRVKLDQKNPFGLFRRERIEKKKSVQTVQKTLYQDEKKKAKYERSFRANLARTLVHCDLRGRLVGKGINLTRVGAKGDFYLFSFSF